jgi:predicted transcriptional regulator
VSDKQRALELLQSLPEEISMGRIIEELQVVDPICRGQADIIAGRFLSHEEVKKRVAAWNNR